MQKIHRKTHVLAS